MVVKSFLSILFSTSIILSYSQSINPKCIDGNCKNKIGTYLYADSSIYVGSFSDKLRNGEGKITYRNKSSYDGQWLDDKRNGEGIFIDSLGNKYEGTWLSDKENGKGRYTDLKNNIYEGVWENGELKGNVTIRYRNKNLYEGKYNNGLSGKGKFSYADGSIYIGEFVKNKRSGYGELSYSFGLTYKGNFVSNEISGQGDFYDNKTLSKIASGNWQTEKTKEGDLIFINSENYVICNYVSKDLYYGQSYNRLPNGSGIMIYSNGDIYNGEWKDGVKEGFGKLMTAKSEESGYWEKGNYIGKEKPVIKPHITLLPQTCSGNSENLYGYYSDATFSGSCVNGLKNGIWEVAIKESGQIIKSITYKNGIKHGEFKEYFGGKISLTGNYENGLLVGRVVNYSNDGNVKKISVYKDGLMDSIYQYRANEENFNSYYLSSVWSMDSAYNRYFLEFNSDDIGGKYAEFFPNGKIKKTGFKRGRDAYGIETEYDIDGNKIKEINYGSIEFIFDFKSEMLMHLNGWTMESKRRYASSIKTIDFEKYSENDLKYHYKNGFIVKIESKSGVIWEGFLLGDEDSQSYVKNGKEASLTVYNSEESKETESGEVVYPEGGANKVEKILNFINNNRTSEIVYERNDTLIITYENNKISSIKGKNFNHSIFYSDEDFDNEELRQALIRLFEFRDFDLIMRFNDYGFISELISIIKNGKFYIEGYQIIGKNKYKYSRHFLSNQMIDSVYKNGILIKLRTADEQGNSVLNTYYDSGKNKSFANFKRTKKFFDNNTFDNCELNPNAIGIYSLNGKINCYFENGNQSLTGEVFSDFDGQKFVYSGFLNYYDSKNVKTEFKLNGDLPDIYAISKILNEF